MTVVKKNLNVLLMCISLMTSKVNSFSCLFAICIYFSFWKCLVVFLAHLLISGDLGFIIVITNDSTHLSVAVVKPQGRDNLKKKDFIWAHGSRAIRVCCHGDE